MGIKCPRCKCEEGEKDCDEVDYTCIRCHKDFCEDCYDHDAQLCVDCGGPDGSYGSYT